MPWTLSLKGMICGICIGGCPGAAAAPTGERKLLADFKTSGLHRSGYIPVKYTMPIAGVASL